MSERTHLSVAFLILAALAILCAVGGFVVSPVLDIFGLVFFLAAIAVVAEMRRDDAR